MFQSLRCAKILKCEFTIDPVRLRMARMFLYHYLEQKGLNIQKDPNFPYLLSQGKDIPSITIDVTLEAMCK